MRLKLYLRKFGFGLLDCFDASTIAKIADTPLRHCSQHVRQSLCKASAAQVRPTGDTNDVKQVQCSTCTIRQSPTHAANSPSVADRSKNSRRHPICDVNVNHSSRHTSRRSNAASHRSVEAAKRQGGGLRAGCWWFQNVDTEGPAPVVRKRRRRGLGAFRQRRRRQQFRNDDEDEDGSALFAGGSDASGSEPTTRNGRLLSLALLVPAVPK